jgi:sugar lactone lactonase YvrE
MTNALPRRRWLPVLSSIAVVACLSGCAPISQTAWRVEPIKYDNATGDNAPEQLIDVTYPMARITEDTAGGIWTESAGSWLHLDENGDTLRRFNDEVYMTVHGISALSPTVLAVSRTDREDASGSGTGLFIYDTEADTWTDVGVDAITTGDVVVDADGRIVFVDFLGATVPGATGEASETDAPTRFAIRAVDSTGTQSTVLGEEAGLSASAVAIDTDSAATVYVSTERETFVVTADGVRSALSTHPERRAVLAVSPGGEVLAPGSGEAGDDVDWAIASGSSQARDVLSEWGDCARASEGGLVILGEADRPTSLPFSCGVRGAAWIDDSTFVISIGAEGGAILATVARPESAEGR